MEPSRSARQASQPIEPARHAGDAGQPLEIAPPSAEPREPSESARRSSVVGESIEPARHSAEAREPIAQTQHSSNVGQPVEPARQHAEVGQLVEAARHGREAGRPLEAGPRSNTLEQRIDAVRRFNRLYTRRIGVLQHGYLHSSFSLAEVRVLYELAHRQRVTATELARELDLDPGYLSRILATFTRRGMLERARSDRDGREQLLSLTRHGQDTFAPLDAAAREQIGALLARLPERRQERLVAAMRAIGVLLGDWPPESEAGSQAIVLRHPRPGDMGWVVERHGAIYAQEYGWDQRFEALVAGIVARFVDHFDPQRERCWIAEREGERVGCVFLVKATKTIGKLRLFLVEPDARGLGIGKRLVDECIRFARDAGYGKMRLWTQSNLLAARHIYARNGFRVIASEPHHSFGYDLVSETWELRL